MNTRGRGQIPARMRSKGNKGKKNKTTWPSIVQLRQIQRDHVSNRRKKRLAIIEETKAKAKFGPTPLARVLFKFGRFIQRAKAA